MRPRTHNRIFYPVAMTIRPEHPMKQTPLLSSYYRSLYYQFFKKEATSMPRQHTNESKKKSLYSCTNPRRGGRNRFDKQLLRVEGSRLLRDDDHGDHPFGECCPLGLGCNPQYVRSSSHYEQEHEGQIARLDLGSSFGCHRWHAP